MAFAQRFAAATAAGLLVGAYHFLDASPPELQVKTSYPLQKAVLCWRSMPSLTRSAAL